MVEPIVALFGEFGGKDTFEEARVRLWGFGGGTGLSEATEDRLETTEDLLLALSKSGLGREAVDRRLLATELRLEARLRVLLASLLYR